MSLSLSSADVHRGHEEQGAPVHHGQRGGERTGADAGLSQGRPHGAPPPPGLRPGPGLLRAPVKTKNLSSALFQQQERKPVITPTPTKQADTHGAGFTQLTGHRRGGGAGRSRCQRSRDLLRIKGFLPPEICGNQRQKILENVSKSNESPPETFDLYLPPLPSSPLT